MILVILFQRLSLHKVPPVELSGTIWLPLGPTGTAAMSMFLFGKISSSIDTSLISNAQLIHFINSMSGIGVFLGIIFWSMATWWFIIAVFITIKYIKTGMMKFNLGFWGYTFPLGVYTMSSVLFGQISNISIIQTYGVTLVLSLFIIWIYVFRRTIGILHS